MGSSLGCWRRIKCQQGLVVSPWVGALCFGWVLARNFVNYLTSFSEFFHEKARDLFHESWRLFRQTS